MNRNSHSFGLVVVAAAFTAAATAAFATVPVPEKHAGDQSRWSLDFRVRLEQQTAKAVEVRLTGEWVSTISAVRQGEYDAQLQIANIAFTGDAAQGAPAASLRDLQRLSKPFWATYRGDGGLLAVHFYRTVDPTDRNLLQMIATELQLVRPDHGPQSWTALERDGAGEYMALYVRAQPDRIAKRKLKYVNTDGVAGAPADAVRVSIDQSSTAFSLAPTGSVQAVDGSCRMLLKLSQEKSGQLATVTEIHLGNLRTSNAPELIGSLAKVLPDLTSSPIVTQGADLAKVRAVADDKLLEGFTAESLLSAAFKTDGSDIDLPERLAALFRRHPEAASVARDMLTKRGPQKRLTNALGRAGTLDAITALATLARDTSLGEDLRADAIMAFIQMQHPSPEAMRIPADLMLDPNPSVRSAARMMSGAVARYGRGEHPAESNAIDASLVALYRDAHESRDAIALLGALGNSASPNIEPVLEEALHDSRVPIRAAAARALRLVPGSEIDELIANVIVSDPDPAVRADAIFAAQFRRPMSSSIADALLHAATADTIDYVRSNSVSLLRQNPAASPLISETFTRIADGDRNPGIRRQASEALAAISSKTSFKP